MPDPSPHTPSRLDDALDRRKFLSFLAAGVVAASLPLPVGFPTEKPPAKQMEWIFRVVVRAMGDVDISRWAAAPHVWRTA